MQRLEPLTSASSKAITFSSSILESISMVKDCPRSVTKVSSMGEYGEEWRAVVVALGFSRQIAKVLAPLSLVS